MTSRARRTGGQSKAADKAEDQAKAELDEAKAEAGDREAAETKDPAEEKVSKVDATRGEGDDAAEAGPVDNIEREGEQPDGNVPPEQEATEGGSAAGEGATVAQQAAFRDTLVVDGDPVPERVDKSMVNEETGLSPEVASDAFVLTAATGDTERNGRPVGIPTDTSGELRRADGAVPTAAFGQDPRNGHLTGMAARGQLSQEFGGNGDSPARLAGDGVRAEVGVGTANPDIGPDERPTYPSTTLTRKSPDAAPMEPEDVKYATQPKLGDVQGSLDPTMAAAQMPSMAGDVTGKLVNQRGNAVKPSNFFEVPEGPQARTFRRVKYRVSEVYTVRHVATPSRRLLFTEGQMVDVDVAETLIRLHG
jgi:hypothetical protein